MAQLHLCGIPTEFDIVHQSIVVTGHDEIYLGRREKASCHTSSQAQARLSVQHLLPTSLDRLPLAHVAQTPLRRETILLKQRYCFGMASRDEYAWCTLE